VANKTNLTLAVFERTAQSRFDLAGMIARFDLWEKRNLGVAESSEERLRLWDQTQNNGRLSTICEKRSCQHRKTVKHSVPKAARAEGNIHSSRLIYLLVPGSIGTIPYIRCSPA
jgi:hypothetical protein